MALFRFVCSQCEAPEAHFMAFGDLGRFLEEHSSKCCGASLARDANPPGVTVREKIDRGTSARAVDQIANQRTLVHERNVAYEKDLKTPK